MIYQKELLRQLPGLNCTGEFDKENGILHIFKDGLPICRGHNGLSYTGIIIHRTSNIMADC